MILVFIIACAITSAWIALLHTGGNLFKSEEQQAKDKPLETKISDGCWAWAILILVLTIIFATGS